MNHAPVLASRTTLRVGGAADRWISASTQDELVASVRAADAAGEPVLVLGGGSNLLVADEGFRGTVVEVATTGVAAVSDGAGHVLLTVAAGEPWHAVVTHAVSQGWAGIEALAGIPGSTGATPVQNVGAYGQEVSEVLVSIRVLDRWQGEVLDLQPQDAGFGYRTSRFKTEPGRWLVLSVTMRLDTSGTDTVRYAEVAEHLGVAVGDRVPVDRIRDAVLTLRRRKGMVLDESDHDTWSAGSFFTNPVLDETAAAQLPAACPRYVGADGVKVSAAWLIESAGISRGFTLADDARAAVSTKHSLAITNRGGASASDVLALANAVRRAVRDRFGIVLAAEPMLVACSLDPLDPL